MIRRMFVAKLQSWYRNRLKFQIKYILKWQDIQIFAHRYKNQTENELKIRTPEDIKYRKKSVKFVFCPRYSSIFIVKKYLREISDPTEGISANGEILYLQFTFCTRHGSDDG